MKQLKSLGYINKIGFSAYNKTQIDNALTFFKPDIIQLPFNVFDQGLLHDGTLALLKSLFRDSREIFILVGLSINGYFKLPVYFDNGENEIGISIVIKLTLTSQLFKFSASQQLIDKVIVGVENEIQPFELLNIPILLMNRFKIFTADELINLQNEN